MSSADTRTRAIEALDRACSLPPAAGMDGEQVGGGRVLLTYEEAVDALLVAGWRPPADDAAVERAALAAAADDLEEAAVLLADWAGYAPEWARSRHNFDADLATVNAAAAKARAALAAAEEGEAWEAVDALLAAGWRPPADDAAIERAARAMYHADRERRGIDPDYTKMARAALAAAEEDGNDA